MLQYSIYHILEIKKGGSYQQYIADFPQQTWVHGPNSGKNDIEDDSNVPMSPYILCC